MFKDAVPIGYKRCNPRSSLERDTKLQAQVCITQRGADTRRNGNT